MAQLMRGGTIRRAARAAASKGARGAEVLDASAQIHREPESVLAGLRCGRESWAFQLVHARCEHGMSGPVAWSDHAVDHHRLPVLSLRRLARLHLERLTLVKLGQRP